MPSVNAEQTKIIIFTKKRLVKDFRTRRIFDGPFSIVP